MALLPDYEDAPVMKEGFLCPECLEAFPGMNALQAHVSSGIHDKELTGNGDDEETASAFKQKPQTMGASRAHIEFFGDTRRNRVKWYEEQTTKLLDRLDKLTTIDAPAEEQKRQMEKQIVSWVADQDVPLCPSCAKSFNFTRRRHHCRLCGAIMCHNCSQFIEYDEARVLVHSMESGSDGSESHIGSEDIKNTSRTSSPLPPVASTTPSKNQSLLPSAAGISNLSSSLLKYSIRRGSTTSLLSAVSQSASKDATSIRICFNCHVLVQRLRHEMEEKRSGHALVAYYQKLRDRMEETEKLVHDYYTICYSFSKGETVYDLQEAQQLRVKLIRLSEEIDVLSKRIGTFGVTDATPPPVSQIQLQSKIRLAATNFLKQYTLGLQSLPTKEEIDRNRERRRRELEEEEEQQRQQSGKQSNQVSRKDQVQQGNHDNSNNKNHQQVRHSTHSNHIRNQQSQ